jgi:hypothetical protein
MKGMTCIGIKTETAQKLTDLKFDLRSKSIDVVINKLITDYIEARK